ncbi:MAG: hypothetical protein SGILL_006755, partial [Bacillariaceae sp.]
VYKEGRLENEVWDPFNYVKFLYPKILQPRQGELDWNKQDNPINEECSICLEEKFDPKKSIVLPCRHQFCAGCIIDWQKGNLLDRDGHQQSDQCPACRQHMPVVEQSLMERRTLLIHKARRIRKKQNSNPILENGDQKLAAEETRNRLCEEALDSCNKAMYSEKYQQVKYFENIEILAEMGRKNYIYKAEILIEMGRNEEALDEINKMLKIHYSVATDPLTKNCVKYEIALRKDDEREMDELMGTMTRQLRGMDRASASPLFVINDAYTTQARAFLAEEEWLFAVLVTQNKLLGFTWKLMANTPWISQRRPLGTKVATQNLEYLLNMGICGYKLKEYGRAIETLAYAVQLTRLSKFVFEPYRYYALTMKEMGDWEEVLKVVTMAALYQPHCESLGKPAHQFFKEMLKDWYENHKSDQAPQNNDQKIDILLEFKM